GIRTLSWMEVGYQVIYSKDPVRVPADLAGVKLRTAPSATDTLFMQEAGGVAKKALKLLLCLGWSDFFPLFSDNSNK
ncbi:hypothetical protein, partial [Okeania sp. SIO2B9]|uniref:hypothetical protein n=1 Tax=Okeania sp. SIO2B9 TaxID=2607782 RepID=UPI00142B5AE3